MKTGDLVSLWDSEKKRRVHSLVIRTSPNPDTISIFMDGDATVRFRYASGVQLEGAIINGKQFLDHKLAAIRTEIADMAKSEYGRQKIREARDRAAGRVDVDSEGAGRRHRTSSTDVPFVLTTTELGEHPRGLERHLAIRDARPDPRDLDPDGHEVRYLDALKLRNPRYYRAYVAMVIQRRRIDELAAQEEITIAAAHKLTQRSKRAYRQTQQREEAA